VILVEMCGRRETRKEKEKREEGAKGQEEEVEEGEHKLTF